MGRPPPSRPMEILLIEDNPGDVLLTQEAFEDAKIAVNLVVQMDGTAALEYLESTKAADGPMVPDLVLLDLNLPGISGRDVLERIRSDPAIGHLPVVILTTSQAPDDVMAAYRAHASSFVTKPVDPGEFLAAIRQIESYWLTIVQLPSEP